MPRARLLGGLLMEGSVLEDLITKALGLEARRLKDQMMAFEASWK